MKIENLFIIKSPASSASRTQWHIFFCEQPFLVTDVKFCADSESEVETALAPCKIGKFAEKLNFRRLFGEFRLI